MAECNLMCLSLAVFLYFGLVSSQGKNFTINDSSIHDVQVDLLERECVVFQMKACNIDSSDGSIVIYLTSQMTDYANFIYYIRMSKDWTSCIFIESVSQHKSHLGDCSGFILSCTKLNWYWISWRNGLLMIGMGQQPGVNCLLTSSYNKSDSPSPIRYMSVQLKVDRVDNELVDINLPAVMYSKNTTNSHIPASIDGSAEICKEGDHVFTFNSTTFSYVTTGMDVSKRNWIVFQAKASSSVYVELSYKYKCDTDIYQKYGLVYQEIVTEFPFYGVSNIASDGNFASYEEHVSKYLNPNAFEWFWISWGEGTVMSGKGKMVGQNTVMSYHEASPENNENINMIRVGCMSETPCTLLFSACYFPASSQPFVLRSEWKSKTAVPATPKLKHPMKKIIVHVTLTDECFTPAECLMRVKAIETYQQQQHFTKLDEIAYNYLIGEDGRVYEGTGQHVGNHTNGHNADSYGIAFIGEFKSRLPIDRALEAFQQLLSTSCVPDLGLNSDFTIAPHYNLDCTLCPNGKLRKWIEMMYPDNYVASSYNCTRGGYVHPAKK